MISSLLSAPLHGTVGSIEDVGFYDEAIFLFVAMSLLLVVGMSWFFVMGEDE